MSKILETKKQLAIDAIRDVHGDMSGPARGNLDAIREIIGIAQDFEAALENDCGEPS